MFVGYRTIVVLCAGVIAAPVFGQEAVNVGGKWTKSNGADPASGLKEVIFTLPADEAELGRSPSIRLECNGDGRLIHARYFADTELIAKEGDYQNYGVPAIIPSVQLDKTKHFKGLWDLLPGHTSAELDKKTLRAVFSGTEMQVRYRDKAYNNFVDMYTLPGLDRREVVRACGEHDWLSAKR